MRAKHAMLPHFLSQWKKVNKEITHPHTQKKLKQYEYLSSQAFHPPFYLLSPWHISSAVIHSSKIRATLPSRRRREAWVTQTARSSNARHRPKIGVAWLDLVTRGGVDCCKESDEIYFNHSPYSKTTTKRRANAAPPPISHSHSKTHKKKELKQCEYLSSRK